MLYLKFICSMDHQHKTIVILGAGFAGVYAFLELHKQYHTDSTMRVMMINRTDYFLFTPLLHEVATGGVSPENALYNIHSILDCCAGDFLQADVQHIDLRKKIVTTSRGEVPYDVLLYALGASVTFFGLSEAARKQVLPLKTIDDAKRIKTRLIELFEHDETPKVVVVGGGATGVEVVAEAREYCDQLAHTFRRNFAPAQSSICLVHEGARLLPQFHSRLGEGAERILRDRSITVIRNDAVVDVNEQEVVLRSGRRIQTNFVIWVAGVAANYISTTPHLPLDAKDRIIVTPYLNLSGYPTVFVAGDAASIAIGDTFFHLPEYFVERRGNTDTAPMTAQAAVAAGKAAGRNIRALLEGKPLTVFQYRHRGDLFSLGQWMAGAEIFGFRFFGHFAWWLWRTIYLSKIIGLRNKVNVAVDWTLNLFLPRDMTK